MKLFSLRVDADTLERLKSLSRALGVSQSDIIRMAFADYESKWKRDNPPPVALVSEQLPLPFTEGETENE